MNHHLNFNPYTMKRAVIPMPHTRNTGYRFKSMIYNGSYRGIHPGEDLNKGPGGWSDEGYPVVAPFDGKVVYARFAGTGWGNLMVIYSEKLNRYSRHAHFARMDVGMGENVKMGQQIGLCGHTGTGSPHHHWEIWKKKLPGYTTYIYGWNMAKIDEYFEAPFEFLKRVNAMPEEELISDWAREAADYLKKEKIIEDWSHPQKEVTGNTIAFSLYKAGFLEKLPDGPMTLEEWGVFLHRELLKK